MTSSKNITAAQDIGDQGGTKTMAGMRADYNAHAHPVSGVQGGNDSVLSDPPDQSQ
ncbi:hypothetical protein PQR34_42840 [Paraburkholderia sediminicola]|uniref:hypothetical protein n=1 Tax=Paraburkholderia sediminicola TaxID=458836 RepID=UPI0038BD19B5